MSVEHCKCCRTDTFTYYRKYYSITDSITVLQYYRKYYSITESITVLQTVLQTFTYYRITDTFTYYRITDSITDFLTKKLSYYRMAKLFTDGIVSAELCLIATSCMFVIGNFN
jgi:hypothetical protein